MSTESLLNQLELDNREHDLVSGLVLQFAQSCDKDVTYYPDNIGLPIMLDMAKGILDKMCVDYVPPTKK